MTDRTDTPEWPTWRTPPKPEKGAINPEDAKIPERIAAQYFRERDRTDTDTLPPDLLVECAQGFVSGYTVATVRRPLAERDERIATLTALLREAHDALHIIDNRCEPSEQDRHIAETLQERIRIALEADRG